jgi:large subunit ribosomal protein L21
MYAIIEAKGKQFRVVADQKLRLPSLAAEPGDRVTFDTVLLGQAGEAQEVLVGRPTLDGASVAVEVLRHGRGDKIIVFKKKRRKGYRRKQGHRQNFTEVRVVEIELGTGKSSKRKADPKAETAAPKAKAASKAKAAPKAQKAAPAEVASEPQSAPDDAQIDATPTARQLAEESGIDLSTVEGTGKEGRILKSDVDAAIKAQGGA